jgi:hypothetical protein
MRHGRVEAAGVAETRAPGRSGADGRKTRRWRLGHGAVWLLLACAGPAHAFLSKEIMDAIDIVSGIRGVKSPAELARAEALTFKHNKDINLAAIKGEVEPELYQRVQDKFEAKNREFVQQAARDAGLEAKTQAKKPGAPEVHNPGTDTDIIVESGKPGQMITEQQIRNTEDAYQKKVREYLNDSGVPAPDDVKVNTDTDFMPHPDHTTPEEFTKINKGINERGGTAYESPGAAKVEAKMRPPKGQDIPPLSIEETGAYVSEMQNLANHKIEAAGKLEADADAIRRSNPAKAQQLDAEAQLLRSQGSKYIDRIDKVTDVMVNQNGVPRTSRPNDDLVAAGRSIAGGRGTGSKAGADVIGDLGSLAVNRGVKEYSETLARIAAKDPAQAAAAQKQIAEQIKHMSPEMREKVMGKARQAYTNSGGLDPDGFGKGLNSKTGSAAAEYRKTHPEGTHDGPARTATPEKTGTPDKPVTGDTPGGTGKPATADGPGGTKRPGAPDPTVKTGAPEVPNTRTRITEGIGTVMVISDIGNACETLEKYLSGEISGAEAAEVLVDQTLTLGLIGAGKKVASSWDTFWEQNETLRQANRQNVVAYYTQWEIQLRKAGLSAADARRLVSQAMASGDSSLLERVADRFAEDGIPVTRPTLQVDGFAWTETGKEILEQGVDTVTGIVTGAVNGVWYIVAAPSRVVEAWAQGELAEAELEFQSASQEAWMKAKLFQRLIKAGVKPRDALAAINDYFAGDMKQLRDMFRKLRGGYVTSHHSQKDWYCTNRPSIDAPVALPPILNRGASTGGK